jgi:hypothetical protein
MDWPLQGTALPWGSRVVKRRQHKPQDEAPLGEPVLCELFPALIGLTSPRPCAILVCGPCPGGSPFPAQRVDSGSHPGAFVSGTFFAPESSRITTSIVAPTVPRSPKHGLKVIHCGFFGDRSGTSGPECSATIAPPHVAHHCRLAHQLLFFARPPLRMIPHYS